MAWDDLKMAWDDLKMALVCKSEFKTFLSLYPINAVQFSSSKMACDYLKVAPAQILKSL